jgi:hypothetical protein
MQKAFYNHLIIFEFLSFRLFVIVIRVFINVKLVINRVMINLINDMIITTSVINVIVIVMVIITFHLLLNIYHVMLIIIIIIYPFKINGIIPIT